MGEVENILEIMAENPQIGKRQKPTDSRRDNSRTSSTNRL